MNMVSYWKRPRVIYEDDGLVLIIGWYENVPIYEKIFWLLATVFIGVVAAYYIIRLIDFLWPPPLSLSGIGGLEPSTCVSIRTLSDGPLEGFGAFFVMVEHLSVTSTLDRQVNYDVTCIIKFQDDSTKEIGGKEPNAEKNVLGVDYNQVLGNLHGYDTHFSPLKFGPHETKSGRFIYSFSDKRSYDFEGAQITLEFKNLNSGKIYKFKILKKQQMTLKKPLHFYKTS